jgi:SAM-dependent methyltransferase
MPGLEAGLALRVPPLLERARSLLGLAGGPPDRLAASELARAARCVEELHRGLVGERSLACSSTYEQRVHLGAYLLWWWPQSYGKVRAALELGGVGVRVGVGVGARGGRAALLDLGSGPGPGAIGMVDHFAARGVVGEGVLVDRSGAALAEARRLGGAAVAQAVEADLSLGMPALARSGGGIGVFDLIGAANLLSELPARVDGRAALVAAAAAMLAPGGRLLLVEPALRETGRALLEVRDRLVSGTVGAEAIGGPASAKLEALAPCLMQRPCPALEHARDWCTAERPWAPPAYLLALSKEVGLHAEAPLQFAWLLLGRAGQAVPAAADRFRVVGVPQAEKGKRRLFVCGGEGRSPVVRLDRDASPPNAPFDGLTRGELVRLTGLLPKGDGLRLGRDGVAERLDAGDSQQVTTDPGEPGPAA